MSCIWTLQLEVSANRRGDEACDFEENGMNRPAMQFDTGSFTSWAHEPLQCRKKWFRIAWDITLALCHTALILPSVSRTTISIFGYFVATQTAATSVNKRTATATNTCACFFRDQSHSNTHQTSKDVAVKRCEMGCPYESLPSEWWIDDVTGAVSLWSSRTRKESCPQALW